MTDHDKDQEALKGAGQLGHEYAVVFDGVAPGQRTLYAQCGTLEAARRSCVYEAECGLNPLIYRRVGGEWLLTA
jgi:hypothetical protein